MPWPFVLLAMSTGCTVEEGEHVCDGATEAGLTVVVRRADTGALLCDASVDVRSASYSEHLQPAGGSTDCRYEGAWERPGEFTVDIERGAFRRAIVDGVQVRHGDCHVAGAFVLVDLSPR